MNNTDIYEFDGMQYYLTQTQENTETAAVQSESVKETSMSEGIAIAAAGFIIVFSVLVIISIILSLLKYTKSEEKKHESKKEESEEPTEQAIEEIGQAETEETADSDEADDTELVAVIAACIAASMNTSADKLIVRSIRRSSSWNRETRHEQQRIYF